MYHLKEFTQLRNQNSWVSMIALDILNQKQKNIFEDIRKGRIRKEEVLTVLKMSYNWRFINLSYFNSTLKKLEEIA